MDSINIGANIGALGLRVLLRILQAVVMIPGTVVLWRFLYPFLQRILAQSLGNPATVETYAPWVLVFVTLWFLRYASAFFIEASFKNLHNYFHLVLVCAVRWSALCILNLLLIPFIGVFIWRGMDLYTDVPKWLGAGAGIVWGLVFMVRGWIYPTEKVNGIIQQSSYW